MKTLFFPGSFNPFTIGHADLVTRGLQLADKIIIGVGFNVAKPESLTSAQKRVDSISNWIAGAGLTDRVSACTYGSLTVDAARHLGADAILRGVRDAADFGYEYNLACINRKISGLETILLPSDPAMACVSSSAVRELKAFGHDVSQFIP